MGSIAVIGGGNMGEALIKGLRGKRLFVCEANLDRAGRLKNAYGVRLACIEEAVARSGVVIFAVKPQDMLSVLKQTAADKNKLYISIAAGLTTKFFEKHLGKVKVVRAMPNMPGLVGQGITGICSGRYAKLADLTLAKRILASIGETLIVKESMLDAVTAVSGSGPAYVFLFVEQWMAAAQALGFRREQAKALVYKTLLGSAHLLEKSEFEAAELRAKVTSEGGTTQAALKVFEEFQFDRIFKQALAAAKKRAKQLAQ